MQSTKILLALFVILTIAFAALSAFEYVQLTSQKTSTGQTTITSTTTVTTSIGYNTACVFSGQPAGAFLRILSESTLAPVIGAVVTATHSPGGCMQDGGEFIYTATSETFTTNGTEWMPLDTFNDGSYSFTVEYSGHSYTFIANLAPVSLTCTTLYVPSGRTNSTITEFKSTC